MILLIRWLYQVARGDVLITQEFGAGHSLPLGPRLSGSHIVFMQLGSWPDIIGSKVG